MPKKKSNIDDMIESKQAPGVTGSKKKYFVDHSVIWDKETNKPLIRAEGVDLSTNRRVMETSNKSVQEKLEKLGYKENQENIRITHKKIPPKNFSVKSQKQVDRENAGLED